MVGRGRRRRERTDRRDERRRRGGYRLRLSVRSKGRRNVYHLLYRTGIHGDVLVESRVRRKGRDGRSGNFRERRVRRRLLQNDGRENLQFFGIVEAESRYKRGRNAERARAFIRRAKLDGDRLETGRRQHRKHEQFPYAQARFHRNVHVRDQVLQRKFRKASGHARLCFGNGQRQ